MTGVTTDEATHLGEVLDFLDTLFEGQEGYVYTPTKELTGTFDEKGNPEFRWDDSHFWKYPRKREEAAKFILSQTDTKDCYVAPSLFKAPSAKKAAWKGTNYVWTEFDGNAPKELPDGIPAPTVRIQSSTNGHEHWYWRLEDFVTDKTILEGLAHGLAYTLDADKSGWDCNQVLRPPGTVHQESRKRVTLLQKGTSEFDFADFRGLAEVPDKAKINTTLFQLPSVTAVLASNKFTPDFIDCFTKPNQDVGKRSSAMFMLSCECAESGLTNEETYVLLYDVDERWGKFKSRTPAEREKRLLGLINDGRSKVVTNTEKGFGEASGLIDLDTFLALDYKTNWLYNEFLAEGSIGMVSSAPGVGKTTLSLQLAFAAATGRDFLKWKFGKKDPVKTAFYSLEMGGPGLTRFVKGMIDLYMGDERELLGTNFKLPQEMGYARPFWDPKEQQRILETLDKNEIKFLVIDSLKAATGLDEKHLDDFYLWLNKYVQEQRGITIWIVHHNRKLNSDNPSGGTPSLDDSYGSVFIAAQVAMQIALKSLGKGKVEVINTKSRFTEEFDSFRIMRGPSSHFYEDNTPPEKKEEKSEPKSSGRLFGG